MKKLSLLLIVALTLGFIGCDTYEDFDEERQLVVGFTAAQSGQNVELEPAEETTKTVSVYVSEVSDQDRTFGVSIDTAQTNVAANNYMLTSNSVTVLAGESTGTYDAIVFTNNSLPVTAEGEDPEVFRLVLQIDRSDQYVSGNIIFTVQADD